MSTDSFGVPDIIFGPLPDRFFPAVGRVVALTALLEERMRTLLQVLNNKDQFEYAKASPGDLVQMLRGTFEHHASVWLDDVTYLDDASKVLEFRNHLVHNLWPAQGDGTLLGHRPGRPKRGESADRITVETDMGEVEERLRTAVRLEDVWRRLYTRANTPTISP